MMSKRKKYWALACGWTGLIYSTLYVVRPAVDFLKKTTPFSELINISCLALLVFLISGIIRKYRIRLRSSYVVLGLIVGAYVYGLFILVYPEEKIHFIEYGILSCLMFLALQCHFKDSVAFIMALVLTIVLGWADEGIQYLLPNRYYQMQDVILNGVSAGLGLAIMFVINREKNHA